VLSIWGYTDLCLTLFDYERMEQKAESRPAFKFLESLKSNNPSAKKRADLNCSVAVWKKMWMEDNADRSWISEKISLTGKHAPSARVRAESAYVCMYVCMYIVSVII
jgi:hypothetical protein